MLSRNAGQTSYYARAHPLRDPTVQLNGYNEVEERARSLV